MDSWSSENCASDTFLGMPCQGQGRVSPAAHLTSQKGTLSLGMELWDRGRSDLPKNLLTNT